MTSVRKKTACNACRQRKTACDRLHPKCGLCTRSNFQCEYTQSEKTPGLRAGYVQKLERRIVKIEQRLLRLENDAESRSSPNRVMENPSRQIPDRDLNAFDFNGFEGRSESLEQPEDVTGSQSDANGQEFTPAVIRELCEIWFRKYHRWFPILHQPSFTDMIRGSVDIDGDIVLQAVIVATVQDSGLLLTSAVHRRQWQEQTDKSILMSAIDEMSLGSCQALLILSALHYGEGNFQKSWNLLAIGRRTAAHLAFDNITDQDLPTASTPTALRRLPMFTNTVVANEEKIRAYWMIQMLDSISTIGARYELDPTKMPGNPLLPCSDSFWAYPEITLGENQIRPYHYCSAFSLCVILAVGELSHVHRFLRKYVNMEDFEERDAWQSEAQSIDERLTAWRDEFVASVFRLINAEHTHHERPEMDAYVVLTNCVLNTAVITLLQQRSPSPPGIEQSVEPWVFASSKCVYACENTAFKVRQMDEDELSICHPHLVMSIFVAARFSLVHAKALDANVPANLHSLAFALNVCGRRWPLAKLFETVLRVAVADYRTPINMSKVPKELYDLRLTTFEIVEPLISWARGSSDEVAMSLDPGENFGHATFVRMAVDALA